MTNHCGTCTACCRIFGVVELSKPAGKWCEHCAIGSGCKIYDSRPSVCREFKCLYLLSQEREDPNDHYVLALRPDKCKVVFRQSPNERTITATTMPGTPLAWRDWAAKRLITNLVASGISVVAGSPLSTLRTMIDRDGEHEVRMTEPDDNGVQLIIPEAR